MSGQGSKAGTVSARLALRLRRPVGPADRLRAALHVLDWTGCAVAGAQSRPAAAMRAALNPPGALDEAFYLGCLGNVLEVDDVDKRALLHPGPVVVPAALAAAKMRSAPALEFLNAVVRGYEAMIRIGRAVGPDHYRYWHNTGTCGPFGAAAAAASIFDLDTERTVFALGLAGTQSSGYWQVRHEPGSDAKQLHTARAAHSGLFAATLAREGFVGLSKVFEGPQGFFAAMCADADPERCVDFADDAPWSIHDVSFKPWAACRHAHAAIDAALALRAAGLVAGEIERATVKTYRDAIVFCDQPSPADPQSAKFSLQHSAAVAFARGAPSLADFEGAALIDPAIVRLRARIAVAEDARLTERYPQRFGAAVEVELRDGSMRSFEVGDALGDPENPVSNAMIRSKALMLMGAGGMQRGAAEALADDALALAGGAGAADEMSDGHLQAYASGLDRAIGP